MPILDISKLPYSTNLLPKIDLEKADFTDQDVIKFISGDKIDSSLLRTSELLFLSEFCKLAIAISDTEMPNINKADLMIEILNKYNNLLNNADIKTFLSNPRKNKVLLKNFIVKMLTKGVKEKKVNLSAVEIDKIAENLSKDYVNPTVENEMLASPGITNNMNNKLPSPSITTKRGKTAYFVIAIISVLILVAIVVTFCIVFRERKPKKGIPQGVNEIANKNS